MIPGGWAKCLPGYSILEYVFPNKINKKIILVWEYENICWIWLFNKNTLNKLKNVGSVRDDLRICTIIRVKRGVYKVTGMDFRCGEDADDFKTTFEHFGGQNHQFSHFYSIFTFT